MPQKPGRPCRYARCPNITHDPSGYCDTHKKQVQRQADQQRGSSRERGYDHRWDKARRWFLNAHPLCAECEKKGRITPANVVDHIIPHKGNQELFWDETNWQSLCASCHSEKTAKEDGGFGNERSRT